MIRRIQTLALLMIALGTVSGMHSEAQAAPYQWSSNDVTLGVGVGHLTGNTLYHISAYDATGGIESELEFPLKTFLLGLEYGYVGRNARGQDALKIGVQWYTNIDRGSGKLKDSDWLTDNFDIQAPPSPPNPPNSGFPHPGLDIYSESDIDLKANIIDLRASYSFWPSTRIVPSVSSVARVEMRPRSLTGSLCHLPFSKYW
jgi:outer membrane protease